MCTNCNCDICRHPWSCHWIWEKHSCQIFSCLLVIHPPPSSSPTTTASAFCCYGLVCTFYNLCKCRHTVSVWFFHWTWVLCGSSTVHMSRLLVFTAGWCATVWVEHDHHGTVLPRTTEGAILNFCLHWGIRYCFCFPSFFLKGENSQTCLLCWQKKKCDFRRCMQPPAKVRKAHKHSPRKRPFVFT